MKQPFTITKISSTVFIYNKLAKKKKADKTPEVFLPHCYATLNWTNTSQSRMTHFLPLHNICLVYTGHILMVKGLTSSHSLCWASLQGPGFNFQHKKEKPTITSHLFCLDTEVVCQWTNSHNIPRLNGCQLYFYVFNIKL